MKDYAKEAVELVCSESEIVREFLKNWEIRTNTKVVDFYSTLSEKTKQFWQLEVLKHARAKPHSHIDYEKKLLKFEIWFSPSYIENPDLPIEVLSLHEFFHRVLWLVRPRGLKQVKNLKSMLSPFLKGYEDIKRFAYELTFFQPFEIHPFNKATPYHPAGICIGEKLSGKDVLRKIHEVGEIEAAVNLDFSFVDEETLTNHLTFTLFKEKKVRKTSLKSYTDEIHYLLDEIISLENIEYNVEKRKNGYLECIRLTEDAKTLDGLYMRFMKDICYIYGIFSSELSKDIDEELRNYGMKERDYFVEERLKPKYEEVKEYYTKNFLWKII